MSRIGLSRTGLSRASPLASAESVESRFSIELSGLGFASESQPGRQHSCSGTAHVAFVFSCTNGIDHHVVELRLQHFDCFFGAWTTKLVSASITSSMQWGLGSSTVFCAHWISVTKDTSISHSQNTLKEVPTTCALSGAMFSVASQLANSRFSQ